MFIYKMSDRVTLNIKGLIFKIAPLSFENKISIASAKSNLESVKLALKYGLKDVSGLKNLDGSEYKLSFEGEELTEVCINELLNIGVTTELQIACISFLNGISDEVIHPLTGKPVAGVTIERPTIAPSL